MSTDSEIKIISLEQFKDNVFINKYYRQRPLIKIYTPHEDNAAPNPNTFISLPAKPVKYIDITKKKNIKRFIQNDYTGPKNAKESTKEIYGNNCNINNPFKNNSKTTRITLKKESKIPKIIKKKFYRYPKSIYIKSNVINHNKDNDKKTSNNYIK